MSRFYLIRHGDKQKTIGNPPLSELGIKQAELTGEHLKSLQIKAIYSSPFLRTFQTAEIISNFFNLPITKDPRLRERINWGDLPGQSFEEFVEMWNKTSYERDYIPPVGDSSVNSGKRMTEFLKEAHNQHKDGDFIVVSHGGVISDFLLNNFSEEELRKVHNNLLSKRSGTITECSVTLIIFDGEKFSIDTIASNAHLS